MRERQYSNNSHLHHRLGKRKLEVGGREVWQRFNSINFNSVDTRRTKSVVSIIVRLLQWVLVYGKSFRCFAIQMQNDIFMLGILSCIVGRFLFSFILLKFVLISVQKITPIVLCHIFFWAQYSEWGMHNGQRERGQISHKTLSLIYIHSQGPTQKNEKGFMPCLHFCLRLIH